MKHSLIADLRPCLAAPGLEGIRFDKALSWSGLGHHRGEGFLAGSPQPGSRLLGSAGLLDDCSSVWLSSSMTGLQGVLRLGKQTNDRTGDVEQGDIEAAIALTRHSTDYHVAGCREWRYLHIFGRGNAM